MLTFLFIWSEGFVQLIAFIVANAYMKIFLYLMKIIHIFEHVQK